MSRFPKLNSRSALFLFCFILFVAALIGIPLQGRTGQVAAPLESQPISLLRPGGDSIEFTLDPTDTSQSDVQQGETVYPVSFDMDVRDLPQIGPDEKTLGIEFEVAGIDKSSDPNFVDPALQTLHAPDAMPAASQNFAGLDLNTWGAGWPPDTNGDVGPNHYIQTVNTSIGIYSKTGSQLAAFTFDTLFGGTSTPCDADNNGDPVVLYDNVSGRWIITDFAWTNTLSGPYYECIAVSKTADPVSGGWWFYGLRADDATHPWLNDYPKLGVWHDGIYMTANMFDCLTSTCSSASYKGVRLWALNRNELINGLPLNYQFADLGAAFFSLIPSNAKVNVPSAGTPNYLMSLQTTTTMNTWKLSIDWVTPANSTLSGPVGTSIASYSNAASVPQLGTTVTLDSLAGRLMVQLQYSNVGGNPALWVTHSVSTSGRAGIRWYEFRNLSGTPSVFQQGTFSPDTTHRWMGSVAVDGQGNMAVGYSASSSSINPQIRYAGRLAGDPLNNLSQGEATLIAGTGSQTSFTRWGDYSALTVDVDGCTFWYTTEYYITTGTNWQTRIGSFTFPGCSGGPTPTPGPTATPTSTPLPPTNTGFLSPSTNAPVTVQSGDNNGYEVNPSNGHADDGLFAVDNNSGTNSNTSCTNIRKDRHIYYNFNINVPGGATVNGFEVRVDARADSTSSSPHLCVQLSWNGGTTWTTAKQTTNLTTGEVTYILGGPTDNWGRLWATGELSNTNFRVRITDVASNTSRDFSLDYVAVNVYYQP
jgi:hypothetical protein